MKKALLLFTDIFRERGLQGYNRALLDALSAEFPDVTFKALSLADSATGGGHDAKVSGIAVECCGRGSLRFFAKLLFIAKALCAAFREKPALVVCGHINLVPVALLLEKMTKTGYAVLTHGIECWDVRRGIAYAGLRRARVIATVSAYSRKRMAANGIDEKKIRVVHDTVDTSRFSPHRPNDALVRGLGCEGKKALLTVGPACARERYKGHDTMLEVMKRLGEGYVWLVIGGGDDMTRLKGRASSMGIADRVVFLGPVGNEEIVDYYNICDCFVMPSKGEGFGIVFLEAMACGKPVIGGNRDGSTEPLMEGRLGFLVDPDRPDEIQEAILRACARREERADPLFLREEVTRHFGTGAFRKQVKEVFSEFFI
jgi:phosphatidylinositol alpha-1,6-mannosyltransferase